MLGWCLWTATCLLSLVVRALGLDVSGLLALVADLLAARVLLGAIAREVAAAAAVVALAAINTLACFKLSR